MNALFCHDCLKTADVYPIILDNQIVPLCSDCLKSRETDDLGDRESLEGGRLNNNFPHLTVKELRKALEGVPDKTPVAYQRIEDIYFETHNWTSHVLPFDYGTNTSEYIVSFSAYWHPTKNVFVINAHY